MWRLCVYFRMPAALLENVLKDPIRGVVLETFGSGNAPDHRPELLNVLQTLQMNVALSL